MYFLFNDESYIDTKDLDYVFDEYGFNVNFDSGESEYIYEIPKHNGNLRFILEIEESALNFIFKPFYHHNEAIEKQSIKHILSFSIRSLKKIDININLLTNFGKKIKNYIISDRIYDSQKLTNEVYNLIQDTLTETK